MQIRWAGSLALGLANAAVPEGSGSQSRVNCFARWRTLSPAALAATKKAIYTWDSMHFDKGLARAEKIYLDGVDADRGCARGHAGILGEARAAVEGKLSGGECKGQG